MEKSLAIANALIQRGIDHGAPLTQMKLQKLVYFAHGWHMALCNTPLVDEEFQAWRYGPVIPSVYHKFKSFGTLGIDLPGLEYVCLENGDFQWVPPPIQDQTGTVSSLLDKIWDVFGKYSGGQLSDMMRAEGSPWRLMRDRYGDIQDIPMSNNLIKNYFVELAGLTQENRQFEQEEGSKIVLQKTF